MNSQPPFILCNSPETARELLADELMQIRMGIHARKIQALTRAARNANISLAEPLIPHDTGWAGILAHQTILGTKSGNSGQTFAIALANLECWTPEILARQYVSARPYANWRLVVGRIRWIGEPGTPGRHPLGPSMEQWIGEIQRRDLHAYPIHADGSILIPMPIAVAGHLAELACRKTGNDPTPYRTWTKTIAARLDWDCEDTMGRNAAYYVTAYLTTVDREMIARIPETIQELRRLLPPQALTPERFRHADVFGQCARDLIERFNAMCQDRRVRNALNGLCDSEAAGPNPHGHRMDARSLNMEPPAAGRTERIAGDILPSASEICLAGRLSLSRAHQQICIGSEWAREAVMEALETDTTITREICKTAVTEPLVAGLAYRHGDLIARSEARMQALEALGKAGNGPWNQEKINQEWTFSDDGNGKPERVPLAFRLTLHNIDTARRRGLSTTTNREALQLEWPNTLRCQNGKNFPAWAIQQIYIQMEQMLNGRGKSTDDETLLHIALTIENLGVRFPATKMLALDEKNPETGALHWLRKISDLRNGDAPAFFWTQPTWKKVMGSTDKLLTQANHQQVLMGVRQTPVQNGQHDAILSCEAVSDRAKLR